MTDKDSVIENENLLKYLDSTQRLSLRMIRQVVKKVWANETPKIIQDFTDHGINHCDRIEKYVIDILKVNEGDPLSKNEIYILLCGIYFHDIGMQCDIIKHPIIKQIAENDFGARLDSKFVSSGSGHFDVEDQKLIRENHHLLSAAWIKYAYQSGETSIGSAVKTIPEHLINDIIDVCKFHSKLAISDCSIVSPLDENLRKQFVAALLRFSDELDIDANHILPETLETFRLPPENSVIWWIHNRITLRIVSRNSITIKIRLNPEDYIKYGQLIHKLFIAEFQTKNRQLLVILRHEGINLTISGDSETVSDQIAEKFPPYIIHQLNEIENSKKKVNSTTKLAFEVRTWLRAINFEVTEPTLIEGNKSEMEASLNQGAIQQRTLIHCVEGEIEPSFIEEIDKSLDRNRPIGWIISEQRVSSRSREIAEKYEYIKIFNLSDFLSKQIWRPYFKALELTMKNSRILEYYEDLDCYKEYTDEQGMIKPNNKGSLFEYIFKWIREHGDTHMSLLGDFGSGKTWFCRYLAFRQLEKYLENPMSERLPLLITLREYSKSLSAKQLINDAFFEKYNLEFTGSGFEVFQDLNRQGKLLLILDGFDEMAQKVDRSVMVNNFWELSKLVGENSKVILSCRTEHFRYSQDVEDIFAGENFGKKTIMLPYRFDVIHIKPLDKPKIESAMYKRFIKVAGEKRTKSMVDYILNNKNLAEMAKKPVFIELIIAAIIELNEPKDIQINKKSLKYGLRNSAEVYFYATNNLILRNIQRGGTFTSTKDKLFFLAELAYEMLRTNQWNLHYKLFPEKVMARFKNKISPVELDYWDSDLRSQTFLRRDADGYYEFDHRSLAEFFISIKFAAELGCLNPKFERAYIDLEDTHCEIPFNPKDIFQLSDDFGAFSLRSMNMATIREFLPNLISSDAPIRLWRLVDEASIHKTEEVKFCGLNAATILQDLGVWYYRDEVKILMDQLEKRPELVVPLRPPKLDKIKNIYKKFIIDFDLISCRNEQEKLAYESILKAYNLVQEYYVERKSDLLLLASDLAEQGSKYHDFKVLALAIQGYVCLQQIYLNDFDISIKMLNKFLNMGGDKSWYTLKLSLVHLHERKYDIAEKLSRGVLEEANNNNNQEMIARASLMLGIIDRMNENYENATKKLNKAKNIFLELGDNYHQGTTVANLGMVYRMIGKYSEAIDQYNKSINIYGDDDYLTACVRGRRGTAYRLQKNYVMSIADYDYALEIFEKYKDFMRKGMVLTELGTTYLILGEWEKAINNYESATKIFNRKDLSLSSTSISRLGLSIYSCGLAYLMQGNWDKAIEILTPAIHEFKFSDNYTLSLFYSGLGIAYRMKDLPSPARRYFLKSLHLVEEMKDYKRQSLLLLKLGSVNRQLREYKVALDMYNQSLLILQKIKNGKFDKFDSNELILREAEIYGDIGIVYKMQNLIKRSLFFYEKALDIFTYMQNSAKISWILGEIGQIHSMQGSYSKAIEVYKNALNLLLSKKGELVNESLINLAEGYILQGFLKGGVLKYQAALSEMQRIGNLSLNCKILANMGEAHRKSGQYEDAIILLEESLEIAKAIRDRDQEGMTLCLLGISYADSVFSNLIEDNAENIEIRNKRICTYEKAASFIKLSKDIFDNLGDKFMLGWALESESRIFLMQELWREAIKSCRKARRLGYGSPHIHMHQAFCYRSLGEEKLSRNQLEIARQKMAEAKSNDYDYACLEAISQNSKGAFELLEKSMRTGYTKKETIIKDPLLKSICKDLSYLNKINEIGNLSSFNIIPFM